MAATTITRQQPVQCRDGCHRGSSDSGRRRDRGGVRPADASAVANGRAVGSRSLARLVSAESTVVLVARSGGKIVGTSSLVMCPIPSGLRARVEDVVVDDSARGQGVGAALIEEAKTRATAAGARTLDLTSRASRTAANRLYERLGFQVRESRVYRFAPTD
ncbi:GNAT family N-acetyltransferase [Nocardia sp. NPDC059764]|uniref:GNAT family N-acetyltransferase n=1 Tax=Nocardia sp. NPDC059764 TaxID=3346939 RepID=UPI00364CF6B3